MMQKKDKSDRQTHERHKIERHCVVFLCDNGDVVVDDDNG